MPYEIVYTKKYERRLKQFLKQHPEVYTQYDKTIEMLKVNPHHPSLRLHKLKRPLQGFQSVSYRITIEFIIQDNLIIPVMVGSHDQVYR